MKSQQTNNDTASLLDDKQQQQQEQQPSTTTAQYLNDDDDATDDDDDHDTQPSASTTTPNQLHNDEGAISYQCNQCDTVFDAFVQLKIHRRHCHPDSICNDQELCEKFNCDTSTLEAEQTALGGVQPKYYELIQAEFPSDLIISTVVKPQLSFATTTTAKSQFASSLFLHKIPHRTLCYHCSQVILPSSSTIFCYVCKLFLHNYCYNGDDKCVFCST